MAQITQESWLLADIGGTNARFALARGGELDPASIAYLRNDDFPRFSDALGHFLARRAPGGIAACCLAFAGPVAGDDASLTNRDWHTTRAGIAAQTGAAKVLLTNDLKAIGQSVALLGPDDVTCLAPLRAGARGNGQALVVNIGTGFNIAFVIGGPAGPVTAFSEAGHVSLPASVQSRLVAVAGTAAGDFPTVEDLFSGRGLTHLHATMTGAPPLDGRAIMARAAVGDAEAARVAQQFARLLGMLLHDLSLSFLPTDGMYLVGSVAGGLVQAGYGAAIVETMRTPLTDAVPLPEVPVQLITSPEAGLLGCLATLRGLPDLAAGRDGSGPRPAP